MHLANSTALAKVFIFFLFAAFSTGAVLAQENSPYSRYGIGDLVPNQNIYHRGMGGACIADTNNQVINTVNPAALANISRTIFDFGGEIDVRTLKSTSSPSKYTGTNTIISYVQFNFPLTPKKWRERNNAWALSFGIQPVSRINYKIQKNERKEFPHLSDSLVTIYEGNGGLNKFNIGTAFKFKNLRLGVSSGYAFGNKDFSTRIAFANDSVIYYKSNTESQVHYGGVFVNAGFQYQFRLNSKEDSIPLQKFISIGGFANFQQSMNAREKLVQETFVYDDNGAVIPLDTIKYDESQKGTIVLPMTIGAGIAYHDWHWTAALDFISSSWNNYRYYGTSDNVQNSWVIKAGIQYYPANITSYWKTVKYRLGGYYGQDYVKLDKNRPYYAVTAGASFPLTPVNRLSGTDRDRAVLHMGLEFGSRGNNQSLGVKESITRISLGLTVNSSWFIKRSYY